MVLKIRLPHGIAGTWSQSDVIRGHSGEETKMWHVVPDIYIFYTESLVMPGVAAENQLC